MADFDFDDGVDYTGKLKSGRVEKAGFYADGKQAYKIRGQVKLPSGKTKKYHARDKSGEFKYYENGKPFMGYCKWGQRIPKGVLVDMHGAIK